VSNIGHGSDAGVSGMLGARQPSEDCESQPDARPEAHVYRMAVLGRIGRASSP
jgi:hypothetical protein